MPAHWYAIRSKPHKERFLHEQLLSRQLEVYYPWIKVKPVNPRSARIRPYFPGYLFVHADLNVVSLSTFQWMPFSSGLVSFADEPATVPDALINAIRQRLQEYHEEFELGVKKLKSGEPVWITDGPFAGYAAIFDAYLPGKERVRVLLQLLNQQRLPVVLPDNQVSLPPNKRSRT